MANPVTHSVRSVMRAALLGVLVFVGMAATPAAAESIWPIPPDGEAGTAVTIKGDLINCYETGPGPLSSTWGLPDTITFYWDPNPLPLASDKDPNDVSDLKAIGSWTKADTAGINIQFTVPSSTKPGRYRFVAKLDPQCNYMGMQNGKATELTDKPSYMEAIFCVLAEAGGPCVDAAAGPGTGSESGGDDGGGSGSGVTIAVLGGVVTIAIGGLLIRARRPKLPSVQHLPERCRGLGNAVNAAASNIQLLQGIDQQLGDELARRTQIQKKNLIKAALGSLVQTTMIVAGGAAEVSAARKAALAAKSGLGVMEHWLPPGSTSAKLRQALELAENGLSALRNQIDDLARAAGRFANEQLSLIAQRPSVMRARQAIVELTPSLEKAEEVVKKLLGSDPAMSPRARYERAEGLLNGIDPKWSWERTAELTRLEDDILTTRHELTNLLKNAEAGGQPLDTWMQEYLALGREMESMSTKGAGTTMTPEFTRLLDRKKELDALGARWKLSEAAELRRKLDLKMVDKSGLEATIKQHNDIVNKVMQDHEKALIDLQNLEAAEGRLTQIQKRYATANEALTTAEQQARDELRAEHNRVLRELDNARAREGALIRERDAARASVEAEQLASSAARAARTAPSAEQSAGLLRQGLTIAGELVLGPETQSTEEIGRIIREGQEYIRLTEARQRAVRTRTETEQSRLNGLQTALAQCVATEEAARTAS